MAREMNVDKRIEALRTIIAKTAVHSSKAKKIADELVFSFQNDKSPAGKQARLVAKAANKLVSSLARAGSSVSI